MYKLTVIAGANRGSSYPVNEGETYIGRQTGNHVVLSSSQVSKKHCSLVVKSDGVFVKDEGSSNGTFVNGVLTKQRMLKPGDRISVGEYVLELVKVAPATTAPAIAGLGNVIQVPQTPGAAFPGALDSGTSAVPAMNAVPTDLKEKLLWYFDKHVMPIFWGMNLKREWRLIALGLFIALVFGNLLISVYPLLESNRVTIVKETGRRAQFMAKQIVERNTAAIAAGAETKTDLGIIEREEGVRVAVLTDLDNRIIAPSTKMNQYFTSGEEALFAVKARDAFRKGVEKGFVREINSSTIVAVEPVRIMSPQAGKNINVGMAIVSLDTSLSTPDMGEMGMAYSETLLLTGLLGGLILLILYRLTLKPLEVLNDDMDKVLKGDMTQVTHEFKFQELDQLWDVISSALQRVSKGGTPGDSLGSMDGPPSPEEYAGPMRMIGAVASFGVVICDAERKVLYINPMFEEISGIRLDNALGQDLGAVARDQSFGPFSADLFDRAPVGGGEVSEDYDFSGISYKVHAASFGTPNAQARCYVLAAVKAEVA